jgi:hypothetical protein
MSLTDITGREIASYKLSPSFLLKVNTTDYAAGLYLYRLTLQDGTVESGKFIVSH